MSVGDVFRLTAVRGGIFAASVSVSSMATYTYARCPSCDRLIMAIPGKWDVETRPRPTSAQWSGRGPVVVCKRCGEYVEVIVHR